MSNLYILRYKVVYRVRFIARARNNRISSSRKSTKISKHLYSREFKHSALYTSVYNICLGGRIYIPSDDGLSQIKYLIQTRLPITLAYVYNRQRY